jgi:ESS family glutamate:Na+ symporter
MILVRLGMDTPQVGAIHALKPRQRQRQLAPIRRREWSRPMPAPLLLDEATTLIAAIATVFLGRACNGWLAPLRAASIPPAVTGGVLVSLVLAIAHVTGGWSVAFAPGARGVLLLAFFGSIGLSTRVGQLLRGGWRLGLFAVILGVLITAQCLAGTALARAFGLDPRLGLFAASIPFVGGHGTVAAWAGADPAAGLANALEVGMACATFGLVLGGLVGGPVATLLMRWARPGTSDSAPTIGPGARPPHVEEQPSDRYLVAAMALAGCVALGGALAVLLQRFGLTLPAFLCAMVAGVLIATLADALRRPLDREATDLFGTMALRVFLAMSLMGLRLWELSDQAAFLVAALALQTLLVAAVAALLVFPLLGRSRDSAALAGATIGFGLGATPVAMGILRRIEARFGATPQALLLATLAVSFVVDYLNAGILQAFFSLLRPPG